MTKFRFSLLAIIAVGLTVGWNGAVNAQGVITQWNFNSNPPDTSTSTGTTTPFVGVGTAALIGGTTATFAGGAVGNGSTDVTTVNNDSSGWNIAGFPTQGTNSGAAGVRFSVDTTGMSNLVFRYDVANSGTASRFVQVQYTTDGSNWTAAATFEANLGINSTTWYNNRTVDLSGVAAANNNSNFAVRVVSIFDPANNTSYTGTTSSYATNGTMRYDAVTVSSGSVWTGAGGTSLGTAGSYQGGVAPTTTGTVLLGTAAGANTTIATASGGTTLDQIVIRAGAPAFTFTGTDALTLNAGLVNQSTASHTFSAPVAFQQSNAIYNSGVLTFNGATTFLNTLTLQGTGTTTFNGTVTGGAGTASTPSGGITIVRVANGSTLAGTGTIATTATTALVDVYAGGIIRGGDPNGTAPQRVGVLTVNGNVTIGSGTTATSPTSVLRVEASRNTSTAQSGNVNADSSVIGVGGILNFLVTPGTKFTIDIVNGTNSLVPGETYTIQLATVNSPANLQLNTTTTGANAIGTNATVAASNYNLTTSSQFSFSDVALFTNGTGSSLFLTFTVVPVPEPATVLAFAVGAMGVGRCVRRRFRR